MVARDIERKPVMRVAVMAASGHLGGAERMALESVRALSALGHQSILLSLEDGPLLAEAVRDGAECAESLALPASLAGLGDAGRSRASAFKLLKAAGVLPASLLRLSGMLRRQRVDLVHSHGIKTHVLAALTRGRRPVIWHLHDYVSLRPASSMLLRRLSRRCDLVIAVSQSVADDARSWLPEHTRVAVVHNAIDTDRFTPDGPAADLDAAAGLAPASPETLRIGLPATFARWKGHDVFLRALAALIRPGVRGYLIGGPVYQTGDSQWSREEIEARIDALGLTGRVGVTGFCADMPAAYRALDVVVHASTQPEPFGLVIPEAMSCGRLVLARRTGGAAELFDHDVNAVGLDVSDPQSLTEALDGLLADPARRMRIASRARAHVVARFGRRRFAEALADAIGQVMPRPAFA